MDVIGVRIVRIGFGVMGISNVHNVIVVIYVIVVSNVIVVHNATLTVYLTQILCPCSSAVTMFIMFRMSRMP